MTVDHAIGFAVMIVGCAIASPLSARRIIGMGLYGAGLLHAWPYVEWLLT